MKICLLSFHFPLGGSQAESPSWKRGGQSQLPPCTPETPSERAALPVVSAEAPTPRLVRLMWCRCTLPRQSPWPAWGGAGAQGRHSARGGSQGVYRRVQERTVDVGQAKQQMSAKFDKGKRKIKQNLWKTKFHIVHNA